MLSNRLRNSFKCDPMILSFRFSSSDLKNRNTLSVDINPEISLIKPEPEFTKKALADNEDEEEMVNMFTKGPMGVEWGGPTRGGKFPEPTRYGDWERKGRASDF
eukprot:gene9804-20393_t